MLIALILEGLDVQLLSMVGPKVIQEWQISNSAFSQALASAVVGIALGAALGGWIGDHVGHRRVLLWSMFGCAALTALTALTQNIIQMATVRFFTGIAIGATATSTLVYMTQALRPEGRASVGALSGACGPAGGMLGSVVVLLIEPGHGWHACFIAAGAAMLLTLIILATLPAPVASMGPARGGANPDAPPTKTPLFTAKNRRINVGAPLAFAGITYMGYSFAWTPMILAKAGLPLSEAVMGYLAYNVMALLGPLVTSLVISRIGTLRLMITAFLIGIANAILLANVVGLHQAGPSDALRFVIYLGIGAMGAIYSILAAALNGLLACGYDDGCRGRGIGLALVVARIGGLAAIIAGGMILDSAFGPTGLFYVIAATLILGVCGCFIINRHVPARQSLAPVLA
ncbi:MFS transporter [Sphingobium sp.]|uniref:MFS transporter n=1 Tax=Sphingobium sp. TaxID=1912891 RepID=UPI0028BF503C|nr:MFS transporter [Sphingobium sp.]